MYNVLIVDEEEHLLSALEENLFPERDDVTILCASTGEGGLEHLKNSRVDLLISDIKMPGKIDGFQLILRAKEVAPDARVIIMTAFGNHRVQNFADRIGITHYIEKPFNTSELRDAVLEILDEKQGFQGVLSDLELTDIIQMLCLARRTALLHLKHRDHRGRIVFENGEVVHGEFDGLKGEDAVFRMLALRQGDIFMQSDFRNDEHTIDIGWQDLLFEGVRRADEERAELSEVSDGEEEGPDTSTGMGLRAEDVDSIVQGGPDIDDEPDPDGSFFSEAELREIELAGAEAVEAADEELPFATLEDESAAAGDGRFGLPSSDSKADEDEFRTPFQREQSALMKGAALSEVRTPTRPAASVRADPSHDDEPRPPSTVQPDSVNFDDLSPEAFQSMLEHFARECPGLRHTSVVSPLEGMCLNSVAVSGTYDDDALSTCLGGVALAAQRTVESVASDVCRELQISAGDEYVLMRVLGGTPYLHIAIVSRDVSLGVALVLMRRFQKEVHARLEG